MLKRRNRSTIGRALTGRPAVKQLGGQSGLAVPSHAVRFQPEITAVQRAVNGSYDHGKRTALGEGQAQLTSIRTDRGDPMIASHSDARRAGGPLKSSTNLKLGDPPDIPGKPWLAHLRHAIEPEGSLVQTAHHGYRPTPTGPALHIRERRPHSLRRGVDSNSHLIAHEPRS